MAIQSNWTATEEAHNLEKGMLGAVIYYSDRSWTSAVVFGPAAVEKAVAEPKAWNQNPQVTRKAKSQLPAVVSDGSIVDGSNFGLDNGKKVLLVSGYPPETK